MVESLMGTFNSRSMCNFQQRQKYGRQTLQDSRCPGHFVNRTSDNRFRFLLGIMVTFIRSSTRTSTGCWGLRHGFIVIKGSFFKKHLMYGHCSLIIGAWEKESVLDGIFGLICFQIVYNFKVQIFWSEKAAKTLKKYRTLFWQLLSFLKKGRCFSNFVAFSQLYDFFLETSFSIASQRIRFEDQFRM